MSRYLFKNARIYDGEQLWENASLLVQDGIIEDISERELVDSENEQDFEGEVYDLEGRTILPGLIDCHIHLDLHGMADTFEENFPEDKVRTVRAAKEMENTLMSGFTTVRNVGSVNWIDLSVKEAVNKGYVNGPRILTSGKILSITCSGSEYFDGLYEEVDGVDGFRKGTRNQLKLGADLIKIMATGAVMNPGGVPGAPQPDAEEMRAAVVEARKLNKKVAAHAHGADGIKNSVIAGVDTIEHGTFADDEAIEMMQANGVFLVPTLAPDYYMEKKGEESGIASFMVEKLRNKKRDRQIALQKAIDKGVKIANGSDAGTPYNYQGNNARELTEMVDKGFMSPKKAITSATKVASEACGLEDTIGSIEKGKAADLIVIANDPLTDIKVLLDQQNITMVMKDGKIVKNLLS
ncbi:metal-dependent hydrolase family protein [Natranaerobius thermophilus]|uniref:Amidohydrolase n=1 Tax=Natranaerobius thermophilus (strain ATCC BAA-1301 / DSM 18059 / JW/NM-WN-LF) TaxID=457570 RepID=B2A295_NATTJ|nr:amidohydrolase family protein [Natranaerobius thermophilus]ACB86201.1 amidohydrolase [Natranaerobius thermophilus JW/NM-WN-LF]